MKLSLCVVGCGAFARTFARAMDGLRHEVDLFFASRDLRRAEACAKEFGGAAAFGSYEAAAAEPCVEAMYLCTPHHLHREHTAIAAGAGKHVLVEKPIARNLEEAGAMVLGARQAGVTLMVAENYRFMSTVRRAKQLIDAGAIGSLRLVQLQQEAPFQPSEWRNQRELTGGGVFIDGGIHKVNVLTYLAGRPVHIFAASLPTALPGLDAEDGLVVMTRSPNGAVGLINHSWAKAHQPGPAWVRASGTRGSLYFEPGRPLIQVDDGSSEQTLSLEDDKHGLVPMVREFRDAIRERRDPEMSGEAGMEDLSLVLKAYESMEKGVSIPLS